MGLDLLGSYLVLDDYELFCVNHLGFRPYPEQIEISDKIDNHNYVLVMMARQSGKSYGISSKILHYALNHSNIRILIFTPKKDQAIDIIFGHIRRWVERSDFLRSFVAVGENGRLKIYKDGYIEFVNGCSIRCLGADARSNIVGYTGDMVVMDEAQSISDMVVDQYIMPMLGSIKNPKVIKIGCIVPESMIKTSSGYAELGYRSPGVYSDSRELYGKDGLKRSSEVLYNSPLPVISVELENGLKLTGTPNHKIWDGFSWVSLGEILEGSYLPIDTSIVDIKSPIDLDRDIAYLMGLYLSDGYIEDKLHRLTITTYDREVSDFLLSFGFKKSSDGHYRISSKSLIDKFRALGFKFTTANDKEIPSSIFRLSLDNQRMFLRGLFDGDGCSLYKHGKKYVTIKYTSSSESLIDKLQILLLQHGIISYKNKRIVKPTKRVKVSSTCYNLEIYGIFAKYFLERIGFSIKRKQKEVGDIKDLRRIPIRYNILKGGRKFKSKFSYLKRNKTISRKVLGELLSDIDNKVYQEIYDKGYTFLKVKKVYWGFRETADFVSLPGDSSYIANGFIVHNTPRGRNHFFRSWRDGKLGRDWVVLEYPWQKCHNLNKAYVEQQRRTNRHFSSEYELQWQTNVRSFFTAQELSRLFVSYDIDKYEKEYKLGNKLFKEVYCGIDWGKSNDNTVISFFARDGNLIRCIGLYILDTGVDYGEQIDRVKELLLLYKPLVTYMDVTGGASSVIGDSFNSLGLYVEGVIFTNKYKSSVLYANLRLAVQNGLVVMPKNDMAELQFYELEETDLASGFTKISHPRGGHDDVPDSVALALLGFSDYIESVSGRRITGYDLGFDIILEGVDRDKIEKEEDDVDLGNRGFKEVW